MYANKETARISIFLANICPNSTFVRPIAQHVEHAWFRIKRGNFLQCCYYPEAWDIRNRSSRYVRCSVSRFRTFAQICKLYGLNSPNIDSQQMSIIVFILNLDLLYPEI